MTTGSRTEGVRGIGSNGFIRTVANLTVTGDLVVLGENRSLAGTGSFFWEVADTNAEYWAFELPTGTSEHVPVLGVGIGLDGVDLGLFNGITQTTLAVLDADRDSFIALDFSGDDAARLRANTAMTISTSSSTLTLTPTTDVHITDGTGLVIGHTAQITANTVAELQVLGSAAIDASVIIGAFSADTIPSELQFVKSRNASVAGNTIVADNDLVGRLSFLPADGVDLATVAATFHAEVEDGSPAAGDIGMAFVWKTMAGGGAALTEKMRLDADGGLKFNQSSTISTSTGILALDAASGQAIRLNEAQGNVDVVIESNSQDYFMHFDASENSIGIFGAADTDTKVYFNFPAITAPADTNYQKVHMRSAGGALTIPSGTTAEVGTMVIDEPNITATGTVTTGFTLKITGGPSQATNNYALWVDDGYTRLDSGAIIGAATSTNNLIDDSSTGAGTTTLYVGNASITVSSDVRLKEDVEDTKMDALSLIDRFRVVDFAWNDPSDISSYGKNYRGRYTGMLAQETIKVAPWVINDQGGGRNCPQCTNGLDCDSHGAWQVEYQHLVPTLVKAIQELRAEVRALKEA